MTKLIEYTINKNTHWRKPRPLYFIGNNGVKYPYYNAIIGEQGYANHGYGGLKGGLMDLPKEAYPFTLEYEKTD